MMKKTLTSDSPIPVTGWCIARHVGAMDKPNANSHLTRDTFSHTREQAWALFLQGSAEWAARAQNPLARRWTNTPENRAWWRRKGTRPVRVILHTIGEAGCRA